EGPRGDAGAGGHRLAAPPLSGDAAHPRDVLGGTPGGERGSGRAQPRRRRDALPRTGGRRGGPRGRLTFVTFGRSTSAGSSVSPPPPPTGDKDPPRRWPSPPPSAVSMPPRP